MHYGEEESTKKEDNCVGGGGGGGGGGEREPATVLEIGCVSRSFQLKTCEHYSSLSVQHAKAQRCKMTFTHDCKRVAVLAFYSGVGVHALRISKSISYIPAAKMARPGTLVKPAECGGFLRRSAASSPSLCCHAGTSVPDYPEEGRCSSPALIKNSRPFPPVKLLGQVPTSSSWVCWCSLVGRSTTCSS